jgi:hypothetical protein
MSFTAGDVIRNLGGKGFVSKRSGHHIYLYLYHNGKKTHLYTYVSHGKEAEQVGNDNQHAMKRQLGLDTMRQVRDLVNCPMTQPQYVQTLVQAGRLRLQPALARVPKP